MEKMARALAHKFARELNYDEEKEQVIAYGLIAIIQTAVTVILSLILGFVVGAPVEAMILCFSVSLLRRYTGGAHVGYIELCTSIGIIYCTVFSYVSRHIVSQVLSPLWVIGISVLVYFLSYLAAYLLVPVDSPRKPIRSEEKKKKMRKGTFYTLAIYSLISVIFLVFSFQSDRMKSYQVSLLFGVAWQVFTLTKAGVHFLDGVNTLYEKISSILKGGAST